MAQTNSDLLIAYTQAQAGQYDQATELLLANADLMLCPEAVDLLARIRVEQGDLEEARRLWTALRESHPDYEPAGVALENLDQPAPAQKKQPHLTLIAFGVVCVCFVVLLFSHIHTCQVLTQVPTFTPQALDAFSGANLSLKHIAPGTYRMMLAHLPDADTLAKLKSFAEAHRPAESILVSSSFFVTRADSRETLSALLARAFDMPREKIFFAAHAKTDGTAILIDFIESTPTHE